MKIVHSIELSGGEKRISGTVSATRTTTGRRYTACIVATTTEKSVEIAKAEYAGWEAELAKQTKLLADATARFNMTLEEAKAHTDAAWDAEYKETQKIQQKIREANPALRYVNVVEIKHLIVAEYAKLGLPKAFDKENTPYAIVDAAREIESLTWRLANRKPLPLGTQGVVSWHVTTELAQKALGALDHLRKTGDRLDIRTDIKVEERLTKKEKAAQG